MSHSGGGHGGGGSHHHSHPHPQQHHNRQPPQDNRIPFRRATFSTDQQRLSVEIAAAYRDALSRGLPDGWICTIDKRNRRKWTAPNRGRSCDSIPKAIAISVDMGLIEAPPTENTFLATTTATATMPSKQHHHRRRSSLAASDDDDDDHNDDDKSDSDSDNSHAPYAARTTPTTTTTTTTATTTTTGRKRGRPPGSGRGARGGRGRSGGRGTRCGGARLARGGRGRGRGRGRRSTTTSTDQKNASLQRRSSLDGSTSSTASRTTKRAATTAITKQQLQESDERKDHNQTEQDARMKVDDEEEDDEEDDGEEEEEDEEDQGPPENPLDPETALWGLWSRRDLPTTVHWDPESPDGAKIGWRVRIALKPFDHDNDDWIEGRVVRYDPHSHKHKIQFFLDGDKNQNLHPHLGSISNRRNDATPGRGRGRPGRPPGRGRGRRPSTTSQAPQSASSSSSSASKSGYVWIWLRNEQHCLQLATRIVWAHVRGFAWWPALVMETNAPTAEKTAPAPASVASAPVASTTTTASAAAAAAGGGVTAGGGSGRRETVQVEFFATGEVSTLRDSPECIRPFSPYLHQLDAVVARHRKKRNAKAFQLACQEYYTIQKIRNEAARYYAAASIGMAQLRAAMNNTNLSKNNSYNGETAANHPAALVGKRVRVFRSDVNYPYGDTVQGKVRKYSALQRKWLVSFEVSEKTNKKYDAAWINLTSRDASLAVLDKKKQPPSTRDMLSSYSDEDILPFLVGFQVEEENDSKASAADEDSVVVKKDHQLEARNMEMNKLLQERCRGCVETWKMNDLKVTCTTCNASYHLDCFDPPMSLEAWQRMYKDGSIQQLTCSRCTLCRGCFQKDIVFGSHPHTPPANLSLSPLESLVLCSMCKDAYDDERYCPNCAHSWDDVKFQMVHRQMQWNGTTRRRRNPYQGGGRRRSPQSPTMTGVSGNGGAGSPLWRNIEDAAPPLVFGSFTGDDKVLPPASLLAKATAAGGSNSASSNKVVDPSFFHPETCEWGYTEIEMLVCDGCEVWVHAGCAGLTEDEYEETSDGQHPIYSKEFLCRQCCRKRCRDLIQSLEGVDTSGLFAEPVNDKMAPNYKDIIKQPMDLKTMLHKAENEEYLNYVWVREMFELMVLNALTFNRYYTRVWYEAERFYHAALEEVFKDLGKAAPPGKYHEEIEKKFEQAEEARKKEEDRVQVDESVEKKDLVAGSMATSITLPELRPAPPDQASCLPFREVKVKSIDAFFFAWMDCCYTCGSSGAADTMLFCVDCGEAFHSFCVSAPVHSMEASSVAGWRCPNCKICEISGDVPLDETRMLFCEMCDRAFSLDLLDPPLQAAPSGLWICGQCVDCKLCQNKSEKHGASLKHWSRHPHKCYRCGGCDGLVDEYLEKMKCSICAGVLRADDDDVAVCGDCEAKVHARCDDRAEEHMEEIKASSRAEKVKERRKLTTDGFPDLFVKNEKKYSCPSCRPLAVAPVAEGDSLVDRTKLSEQAWQLVVDGNLAGDNYSRQELHTKLMDEIEWQTRALWRDEYLSIIVDGLKLVGVARETLGDPRVVPQQTLLGAHDVPRWMAQRALRFCVMVKRSNLEAQGWTSDKVASIVSAAKLAAAFASLACRTMRLDPRQRVSKYDRMVTLLKAPLESEIFVLPSDLIRNASASESNSPATGAEAGDSKKAGEDDSGKITQYKIAAPLCGWNDQEFSSDSRTEWKDPRECCLCHVCGDDDAGFTNDETPGGTDYGAGEFPPLGRLLPMADGFWVHTSCALWSSEVWEEGSDALVHAVEKARCRGAQLKCFGCGRYGATVGCNKGNCPFNYHFQCGAYCGGVFTSNQLFFCANHKSFATSILHRASIEHMKALMVAPEKKVGGADKESSDVSETDLCSRVGTFTVHSLGTIETSVDGFHSDSYIWPPGYVATRIFWSARYPRTRTLYVLRILRSQDNRAEFSILPGDDPSSEIRGSSVSTIYSTLVDRVRKVNAKHFAQGNRFSKLPVVRRTRKKTFGLNGPQFFGFGLNHIRKTLELRPGIEAVVAQLTPSSPKYRFCYVRPGVDVILDLFRKRAAAKAEKDLENASGCARTEGIKAVARSGGSGRITRALVRSAEEDVSVAAQGTAALTKKGEEKAKADRNLMQAKYKKMKAIPMEKRLVARRSHIHGYGLFTKLEVRKDDAIVEYIGEVICQPVADQREGEYEKSGEGSCYMFRLDLHRIVDATKIGCMARFMNHSCQSNAYAKIISVSADSETGQDRKIVVFAKRNIAAGEEITYDYKFPVEDGSLKCMCGAANCIGRLN